jgi:hypothetical protein
MNMNNNSNIFFKGQGINIKLMREKFLKLEQQKSDSNFYFFYLFLRTKRNYKIKKNIFLRTSTEDHQFRPLLRTTVAGASEPASSAMLRETLPLWVLVSPLFNSFLFFNYFFTNF